MTETHTPDGGAGPGDRGPEAAASPPAVPDHADGGSAGAPQPGSPARRGRPSLVSALAILLALLATAAAGLLWWQTRELYVDLHDTDSAIEASLQRVRASQRELSDRLDALADQAEAGRRRAEDVSAELGDLPRRLAELETEFDALPPRIASLERRTEAALGTAFDARAEWLRAEAEYYLTVAVSELELAGRWDNAATALELADGRLRELGDPAFAPVRREIAAERLALDGVERPDIERVVFELASLGERVEELALRGAASPRDGDDARALDEAEPGLERLLLGLRRALGSLVSVERRGESAEEVTTAQRRSLARQSLALQLQLAQAAAMLGRAEAYRASVAAAATLLDRDFDAGDSSVRAAAERLASLAEADVAPEPPRIGRSLSLLRNLPAAGEE